MGPNLLEGRVGLVKGGIRAQVSRLSPRPVHHRHHVRPQEAVDLLKGFYDQENPFAPSPKVKGVRVHKTGQACKGEELMTAQDS